MGSGICRVVLAVAALYVVLSTCLCTAASNAEQQVTEKSCNVYVGKWVYDESYPLFNSTKCPFIRKEFDCSKYGRPDDQYLKYRWQPDDCDLPRFDGLQFLRRLRGRKIMFIGDSTSLNQWQSLTCLLYTAVYGSNVTQEQDHLTFTVAFQNKNRRMVQEYGVSVMYFSSQYLVDIEKEEFGQVLKLNSLKKGDTWKQVDVLVFNTWLWWYRKGSKKLWDYIEDDGIIVKDMDRMVAFSKALMTWAKWVESDVDFYRTKVFFRGISPSHYNGWEWNKRGVTNCGKETRPIIGSTYSTGMPKAASVVKDIVSSNICSSKSVHLLDITTLSQLRKDGHPSAYNGFQGMDCTHWCVAGIPDTWNQLLYSRLLEEDIQDGPDYFTADYF
ncbi:hypothetical protein BUALT_Bualt01G0158400 [Buddleja alternifolia]|uniref:Trichome birefringence-like N-terminal domain-containing protein n=1 Tax=Buddleja alternifolia TaxID=168488 RepID=A0AAV6YIE5_9LAMI|nr:hypothetical protein BUALT_Bualt01G0158400 [Buddleja alternifolia]